MVGFGGAVFCALVLALLEAGLRLHAPSVLARRVAFVLLPLLAPVAHKLGIDLVWFGILVRVNLQASFMTPPFGFSLMFLRGVASRSDTINPDSGRTVRGIGTHDIYIGILPFVGVQLLVLGLLIAWPGLVLREAPAPRMDAAGVERELERITPRPEEEPPDPLQMLLESLRRPE